MRLLPAGLPGARILELEPRKDDRGAFARTFCAETFRKNGLDPNVSQQSLSYNTAAATLRGLHFQRAPHGETKLIRCVSGSLFDAFVDLRPASSTFGNAAWIVLSAENARALYLPAGFAHGFYTLEDRTTVLYQMSTPYVAEAADGVRWDDPAFGIPWPGVPLHIADKDRTLPTFSQLVTALEAACASR